MIIVIIIIIIVGQTVNNDDTRMCTEQFIDLVYGTVRQHEPAPITASKDKEVKKIVEVVARHALKNLI